MTGVAPLWPVCALPLGRRCLCALLLPLGVSMINVRLSVWNLAVLLLSEHAAHLIWRFFVLAETLPTVCGTSFSLRKCISCT